MEQERKTILKSSTKSYQKEHDITVFCDFRVEGLMFTNTKSGIHKPESNNTWGINVRQKSKAQ